MSKNESKPLETSGLTEMTFNNFASGIAE